MGGSGLGNAGGPVRDAETATLFLLGQQLQAWGHVGVGSQPGLFCNPKARLALNLACEQLILE